MIQQTAPTHRVECQSGHVKLISNLTPTTGYTAYCRRCQMPHMTTWESLPTDVLSSIVEAISGVLVARRGDGV